MKYITIYLSSFDIGAPFLDAVRDLGRQLVAEGFGIVYGGSDKGLMKELADTVIEESGQIIGVSSTQFSKVAHSGLTELIVANGIEERKRLLLQKADGIVVFPGGSGTLDEAAMALDQKKLRVHAKPIVFLNIDGFWDHQLAQLQKMRELGFLAIPVDELAVFRNTVESAVEYLQEQL